MRTSDPCIFAVGMRWRGPISSHRRVRADPLAGPANRQGASPPTTCWKRSEKPTRRRRDRHLQAVSIWRWRALGAERERLRAAGLPFEGLCPRAATPVTAPERPPRSASSCLFCPDGKIYGAQAIGKDGSADASTCWRWPSGRCSP